MHNATHCEACQAWAGIKSFWNLRKGVERRPSITMSIQARRAWLS